MKTASRKKYTVTLHDPDRSYPVDALTITEAIEAVAELARQDSEHQNDYRRHRLFWQDSVPYSIFENGKFVANGQWPDR